MDRTATRALIFGITLAALGCDDLDLDDETEPRADAAVGTPAAPADTGVTAASGDAPKERVVDASAQPPAWAFLDLDTGAESKDEAAVPGWDIALQRSNIRLKSGARATFVAGATFDALTQAPSDGWATDTPGERPAYFLSSGDTSWYAYDLETHVLTPRPNVYVVQTDAGFQKLTVLGWKNDAGTTGFVRLKFATVAAPRTALRERDAEVDVSTSASVPHDAGTQGGN